MRFFVSLLLCLAAATPATAASGITESGVRLDTGRDFPNGDPIRFRIGIVEPKKPQAIAILLAGGRGIVNLNLDGSTSNGNFLVRARRFFAENGVTAVVVDAPHDRQLLIHSDGLPVGLGLGFRRSETHADDIQVAIDHMRQRNPGVPIWLVGTSRGSTSVAYATMHLKRLGPGFGPDGIVLTSALLVPLAPATEPADGDSLFNPDFGLALSEIEVPTLVAHHIEDACAITPYAGVAPLVESLSSVTELEVFSISGGGPPLGPACEAFHYHGFVGIEEKVVKRIAHWVRRISVDLAHGRDF